MKRPTNRGIFVEKEKSGVGYERKEKGDDLHDHNFYEGFASWWLCYSFLNIFKLSSLCIVECSCASLE